MHLFNRGDVVYAWYSWLDENGNPDGGLRPVVIKELIGQSQYRVIKITRTARWGLYQIKSRSKEWDEMGLYDMQNDSYIDKSATLVINENEINEKLGTCPPSVLAHIL